MLGAVCFGAVMVALFSAFLLFGAVLLWRSACLRRAGVHLTGRVVDHVRDPSGECDLSVVEFVTPDGTTRRSSLSLLRGGNPPIGGPLRLVDNTAKHEVVAESSASAVWVPATCCCIVGATGVVVVAAAVAHACLAG